MVDLERTREEGEAFLRELREEEYRQGAGLQVESRQSEIYARHPDLASFDAARDALQRALALPADEGARLRFLAEFLALTFLEAGAREEKDRLLTAEASAIVETPEGPLPLRAAGIALRNEAGRSRRAALEAAECRAHASLNTLRRGFWVRLYRGAARLGFADYATCCQTLSGIDLAGLQKVADDLLARTDDMYGEVLKWFVRRHLGIAFRDLKRHDLLHLFRGIWWDQAFPANRLLAATSATLEKMRLDGTAGGRITIDADERPQKSARAFAAPIEVPGRVVVVVRPAGGWADYQATLHELGHALHYANTDPGLPWEFRRLGDASVAETHAFLMEGILREPGFLCRFLDLSQPQDFLRLVSLHKLYLLRRYAAKLAYELGLHRSGTLDGQAEAYATLQGRATLAESPRDLFLFDVDPHFYAARYLRAWIFEARLKELLIERFDEEWFRNDRTGPFLLEAWRWGHRYTLEGLGQALGIGEPPLDPLIVQIARHLD